MVCDAVSLLHPVPGPTATEVMLKVADSSLNLPYADPC